MSGEELAAWLILLSLIDRFSVYSKLCLSHYSKYHLKLLPNLSYEDGFSLYSALLFLFRSNNLESKSNFSKFLLIADSIQLNFIEERKNDGGYNRNENILKIRFSLVYVSLMTADSFPNNLGPKEG